MLKKFAWLSALRVIDLAVDKTVKILYFLCLLRLVPRNDIGVLGAAEGYVAIFAFGLLNFSSIWLRDVPRRQIDFNRAFSAGVAFWTLKAVVLLGLAAVTAGLLGKHDPASGIGVVMWLMLAALLLLALRDMCRDAFLVRGRQTMGTLLGLALNGLQLAALGLLIRRPSVTTYLALLVGANVVSAAIWYIVCRRALRLTVDLRGTGALIWSSLSDFVLWNHLNNAVIDLLLSIGASVLSYVAPLTVVGSYTVAVKLGVFSTLVPGILASVMLLSFSQAGTVGERIQALRRLTILMAFLGLGQFFVACWVGPLVLRWFMPSGAVAEVFQSTVWILAGTSLLVAAWPIWMLAASTRSQRDLTLNVFLPGGLIGIACITAGAVLSGAIGTAMGTSAGLAAVAWLLLNYLHRHRDELCCYEELPIEFGRLFVRKNPMKKAIRLIRRFSGQDFPPFIYKGHLNSEVPIFIYHSIRPESFEVVLKFLKRNGYETLTAADCWRSTYPRGARRVLLTFDDGDASLYTVAYPLLKRYGFRATGFLVPDFYASSSAQDERDASARYLTWDQVETMYGSGVIDVQSHSLTHAKIFVGPRLEGFLHPDVPAWWSHEVIVRHEGEDRRLDELPWGTPIYEMRPRLQDRPRYFDDEALRRHCVAYVAEHGGEAFFLQKHWTRALYGVAETYVRANGIEAAFESLEQQRRAIVREVVDSKTALEQRLRGHQVQGFCAPWNTCGVLAVEALAQTGYRALFGGFREDIIFPQSTEWPKQLAFLPRLEGDFLWRLPGEGRRSLTSLWCSKIQRMLTKEQDDAAY